MNVKINYYENGTGYGKDNFTKNMIEGELVWGNNLLKDYIGVKTDDGYVIIPSQSVISIEAETLDSMFLTDFELLKQVDDRNMRELIQEVNRDKSDARRGFE